MFPLKYLPFSLSKMDTKKQKSMLQKSKKLYKKRVYFTRKKVASFLSKPSKHITKAKRMYNLDAILPNKKLSIATGCSIPTLKKIVRKGKGAYFSSGSRPNQTATSWGLARLASSITGGKSAAVDFNILEKGCQSQKPALKLAKIARNKYKHGMSSTRKRHNV